MNIVRISNKEANCWIKKTKKNNHSKNTLTIALPHA